MNETIARAFSDMMKECDLLHCPLDQYREMRNAFFAGCWWMYIELEFSPTSKGIKKKLEAEMLLFKEDVVKGTK